MNKNTDIPLWRTRDRRGCALAIETHSYCNQRCPECPRTLDPTRSRWRDDGSPIKEFMPEELVYRLIREAEEMGWRGHVHFSHYSEPLLDPRFPVFCRYARKHGLIPELFTNGTLLTPEYAEKLDGLVDNVVLSYRTPGNRSYWQSMFKESRVRITPAYQVLIWSPNKKLLQQGIQRVVGEPCVNPLFTACRINYDGRMSLCYADFNNEWNLLNAHDHSLRELWYGDEHVEAVEEMSKPGARRNHKICRGCPEVFPDGGLHVPVDKPSVPPDNWFKRERIRNLGLGLELEET